MAKDPAFLFYPGDWLGGTMTFSRAQKGAYMDLLMAQFNQVGLTISDIKQILGTDFWMWDSKLKFKFQKESNGLYFNPKLRSEIIRRRLFTQSRKDNLHMNTHMDKHMDEHMETETVNENEVKNVVKKTKIKNNFHPPSVEEVRSYCNERRNKVDPQTFIAHYQANGWMRGKNKVKDWKACVWTWEKTHGFKPKEEEIVRMKPDPRQQEEVAKLMRETVNKLQEVK